MAKNLSREEAINEVSPEFFERDIRPLPIKFGQWFVNEGIYYAPLMFAALAFAPIVTNYSEIMLLLFVFFYIVSRKINIKLPFKKPMTSGEIDHNELNPATDKPEKSEGITYFGRHAKSSKQAWFTNSDIRTHILIFGTTGAGKTETLLSLVSNAIIQLSGFIYVDGKADTSLFGKVFSMLRRFMREDDLLVLNYMMDDSFDNNKKSPYKITNTMNPFASGSSSSLTELIGSLLPGSDGGDMWRGRAMAFVGALMRVLVALRDDGKLLLDAETIRDFFNLEKLEQLIKRDDIDPVYLKGLKSYILDLPGYDPNAAEQEFDVKQQHGFITMQLTEIFGLFADEYQHMMKTQLAEVDFYDVVVRRRILLVLLPALSKSPQSLQNLGKIIVSSVRMMMSSVLGSDLEGSREDVLDRKPTNSPTPYTTVFDEYGYYSVEGAAVMPAQARGIGFSMIFAGQDYQAFKKGSAEEAASIVANCAVKICMKLEDPTETFEIFQKAAGDKTVASSSGYNMNESGNIKDSGNISFNTKSRITIDMFKKLRPGQAFIMFGPKIEEFRMYYAAPKMLDNFVLTSFVKVYPPDFWEITDKKHSIDRTKNAYYRLLDGDTGRYDQRLKSIISDTKGSDLGNVISMFRSASSLNNLESAQYASIGYIKKIENVDNQLLRESKMGRENFNAAQRKEMEKIAKEAIDRVEVNDLDEVSTKDSLIEEQFQERGRKTLTERLEEMLNNRRGSVQDRINPFESITPDQDEIFKNIVDVEDKLIKHISKNGELYDEDLENPRYKSLAAQNTIEHINASTAVERVSDQSTLSQKEKNEQIIRKILEEIDEE